VRLSPGQLLALFAVGALGGLVGDQGHVASGTTVYLQHGVPFVWRSAIWFPMLVGTATAAAAELRLRLGRTRPGDALEAAGAIAAVIGIYAVTALVRHQPLGPATALVAALAVLVAARLADGPPGLLCGAAAALGGTAVEVVMVKAGVFRYADAIDPLAGVPPWLPALYFAFGVVAARLGEILACRSASSRERAG
jgi:hypothetical protein